MVTFKTHYTPSTSVKEKNSGVTLVERAGYVPVKVRIESMMDAGRRLKEWRESQFDFPPEGEIDESFVDPTRSGNFDLADAFELGQKAGARLDAAEKEMKAAKAEVKEADKEKASGKTDAKLEG